MNTYQIEIGGKRDGQVWERVIVRAVSFSGALRKANLLVQRSKGMGVEIRTIAFRDRLDD